MVKDKHPLRETRSNRGREEIDRYTTVGKDRDNQRDKELKEREEQGQKTYIRKVDARRTFSDRSDHHHMRRNDRTRESDRTTTSNSYSTSSGSKTTNRDRDRDRNVAPAKPERPRDRDRTGRKERDPYGTESSSDRSTRGTPQFDHRPVSVSASQATKTISTSRSNLIKDFLNDKKTSSTSNLTTLHSSSLGNLALAHLSPTKFSKSSNNNANNGSHAQRIKKVANKKSAKNGLSGLSGSTSTLIQSAATTILLSTEEKLVKKEQENELLKEKILACLDYMEEQGIKKISAEELKAKAEKRLLEKLCYF